MVFMQRGSFIALSGDIRGSSGFCSVCLHRNSVKQVHLDIGSFRHYTLKTAGLFLLTQLLHLCFWVRKLRSSTKNWVFTDANLN